MALTGCAGAALPTSPSVILISFDTCRADVFGVLGGGQPSLTPHLDAFAEDAVIFESAFAQIPHTLPSHMSLFTSVYPDVHGVKPDLDPLPPSITTLPQILQAHGYRTAGLVTSEWLKADFGFGRGFDHYERLGHDWTYAERVNKAALRHLRLGAMGKAPDFLFLHYYDLHSDFEHGLAANKLPYYSLPPYREELAVSADGQEFCDKEQRCNTRYLIAADVERRVLPQREIDTIHQLYRAAVPLLDAQMGALFDDLRELGLYDGSLIVVTSDHGEEFREHGRFIHSQPYDETIHVPLFVKFPGSWKAGSRIPEVVETVDILPTLLEYLGIQPPDHIQGESLLGLLDGRREGRKQAVLSQDSINKTRYGLRTKKLKLIMDFKTSRRELYDLEEDPGEKNNLASRQARVADKFEAQLEGWIRANRLQGQKLEDGEKVDRDLLSAEERERLRALGYLN